MGTFFFQMTQFKDKNIQYSLIHISIPLDKLYLTKFKFTADMVIVSGNTQVGIEFIFYD